VLNFFSANGASLQFGGTFHAGCVMFARQKNGIFLIFATDHTIFFFQVFFPFFVFESRSTLSCYFFHQKALTQPDFKYSIKFQGKEIAFLLFWAETDPCS